MHMIQKHKRVDPLNKELLVIPWCSLRIMYRAQREESTHLSETQIHSMELIILRIKKIRQDKEVREIRLILKPALWAKMRKE
jgi:hypothetical protein